MSKIKIIVLFSLMVLVPLGLSGHFVPQFDQSFFEDSQQGEWLVFFHVPWCGFCHRAMHMFEEVHAHFNRTNSSDSTSLQVGLMDCAIFPHAVKHFKLIGYPTFLFIKDNVSHHYQGYRLSEFLIDYVEKMQRPALEFLGIDETIKTIREKRKVFFMYAGPEETEVLADFHQVSRELQHLSYFYATTKQVASLLCPVWEAPRIFAYKQGLCMDFKTKEERLLDFDENDTSEIDYLRHWVKEERFEVLPKVDHIFLDQVKKLNKLLVLAVVYEPKAQRSSPDEDQPNANKNLEFLELVKQFIYSKSNQYHNNFQFGFIDDVTVSYPLVLRDLPAPFLIVKNLSVPYFYLYKGNTNLSSVHPEAAFAFTELFNENMEMFLVSILADTIEPEHQNRLAALIKHAAFKLQQLIVSMWRTNRTGTIFVLGTGVAMIGFSIFSLVNFKETIMFYYTQLQNFINAMRPEEMKQAIGDIQTVKQHAN